MIRRVRVLPLAALCLFAGARVEAQPAQASAAAAATAEPPADPSAGPTACPAVFEFEGRLRALLEQSTCAVPERKLLVTLHQEEAVCGTLVVLKDYQAEFVREVRGPTCGEVEAALALALEIFLDPGPDGEGACVAKEQEERPADAPDDWPGKDLDPFDLPESEPRPLARIAVAQPRGLVRAVAQLDSSFSPNVAFGVAASARLRVTPQNFLALTVSQQVAPPFNGDGTVYLSATTIGPSFGQFLPIGAGGEFSLQAGPRVSLLEVGTSTFGNWEFLGTVAIDVTMSLGFRVGSGFWTGVQGGGVFNVLRGRYLDGAGAVAWEQPWAGGFVGLYFSAAFAEGRQARSEARR